ncbi:MAG: hypothetical protein V3T17_08300 [Pseudomonadales bacterium]
MKEQLKEWQQKIDAFNQRERILLLVTGVAVVIMLLQSVFIDPVMAGRKVLGQQVTQLNQQIQQQTSAQLIISAQLTAGVNRNKTKQRDQLQREVDQLNKKITESMVAMIPPRLMPEVLENILSESTDLKLLSLENIQVVAVLEQKDEQAEKSRKPQVNKQALYKHGFVLRLRGNYMAAIRYFNELSKLPWRFHWDNLHYKVDQYPNATITLEVHTVSMSEEWIGV